VILGFLTKRFRKQHNWRQEHIVAFREVTHIQADGLTRFQHQCMTAIAPYVPPASFRRVTCPDGDYVVAPFGPKNVKVFIYPKEAGLWGPDTDLPLEEWSYKLPNELIASLVHECASRAT
jgi:hypothetical protein